MVQTGQAEELSLATMEIGRDRLSVRVLPGRLVLNGEPTSAIIDCIDGQLTLSDQLTKQQTIKAMAIAAEHYFQRAGATGSPQDGQKGSNMEKKPIRRRPGDLWQVWRMEVRDKQTGKPRMAGYLVTTGNRWAKPLAIVQTLADAWRVQAKPELAAEFVDLRDKTGKQFPRFLWGMMLYPVNRLGRAIGNSTFIAARFLRAGRKTEFNLLTRDGLEMARDAAGEKNSGHLSSSGTHQLAGRASAKAKAQKAA